MKNFLKVLDIRAVLLYFLFFLFLNLIGVELEFDNFGLNFSLPITLIVLVIDLLLTYKKYKKYKK